MPLKVSAWPCWELAIAHPAGSDKAPDARAVADLEVLRSLGTHLGHNAHNLMPACSMKQFSEGVTQTFLKRCAALEATSVTMPRISCLLETCGSLQSVTQESRKSAELSNQGSNPGSSPCMTTMKDMTGKGLHQSRHECRHYPEQASREVSFGCRCFIACLLHHGRLRKPDACRPGERTHPGTQLKTVLPHSLRIWCTSEWQMPQ